MLENSKLKIHNLEFQNKKYYFRNLIEEKSISFFINGIKDKEINNKKYNYNKAKRELYEYQNKILKDENAKLNKMVILLEKNYCPMSMNMS